MIARTQIGGEYDERDLSLFDLKRKFKDANIEVTYPASEGITHTLDGRGYAFDPRDTSFFDVETDYYCSIANSDFHTVNNRFLQNLGYIGGYSDEHGSYRLLKRRGYRHETINHSQQQYVIGHVYPQNVENFWSIFKRGIYGVYRHCDPKYLQQYANEYAFRYSIARAIRQCLNWF